MRLRQNHFDSSIVEITLTEMVGTSNYFFPAKMARSYNSSEFRPAPSMKRSSCMLGP